jgi:uncharacterized membrane protein YgdD (TMEM256/DUF423 family)
MTPLLARRIAALAGFLAVLLGAIGAHALREKLAVANPIPHGTPYLVMWERAVLFHLAHAVVLLLLSLEANVRRLPYFAFLLGIVLFSGSLYLYAPTRIGWVVAFTPFGGVSFMVGWLCLALCKK